MTRGDVLPEYTSFLHAWARWLMPDYQMWRDAGAIPGYDAGIPTDWSDDMPFGFWGYPYGSELISSASPEPLATRPVAVWDNTRIDTSPGRRLRVFAGLVMRDKDAPFVKVRPTHGWENLAMPVSSGTVTYGPLLNDVTRGGGFKKALSMLPLRSPGVGNVVQQYTEIPERPAGRDAELVACLQDLGYEINEDIREACFAFDDPDVYYPGIDEGIEPVTDDHIDLVIWALQRELNRELRPPSSGAYGSGPLPAAPLADLPQRVKRALVERRRWRYAQYGIGREQFENNNWSLFEVMEEPEWVPRRAVRLSESAL